MITNQYDVEQSIMDCWSIVDTLNEIMLYAQNEGTESVTELINSVIKLYEMKFQNLFDNYSALIAKT